MKLRWGVIGCGDIVRKRVAMALQDAPNSELLAACRRDRAKLAAFCGQFGVTRGYLSADEMLRDPEIDAVYIATPVSEHHPLTLAAAKAGKHVLVEKPMAMTVAQCQEMIDAAAASGVRLGVAYYRRFYPVFRRIQQLIAEGAIGRVLSVIATASTPLAMAPGEEGYWRVDRSKSGGGALMDVGSHRIDLLLELFGKPTRVEAICREEDNAEEAASVILAFKSGVQGIVHCLFGPPTDFDDFIVTGTSGRLSVSPLNQGILNIDQCNQVSTEKLPPCANLHLPLVRDFVESVLNQRDPSVTGFAGLKVNDVIQAAYSSTLPF